MINYFNKIKGWSTDLKHDPQFATPKRNSLTLMDYYRYRICIRHYIDENNNLHKFNILHYAGKLFQQYLVDAFVKVEGNNINYIRQNQSMLRTDKYLGLMDYINNQAQLENCVPGKIFILPSTYIVYYLNIILNVLIKITYKIIIIIKLGESTGNATKLSRCYDNCS